MKIHTYKNKLFKYLNKFKLLKNKHFSKVYTIFCLFSVDTKQLIKKIKYTFIR